MAWPLAVTMGIRDDWARRRSRRHEELRADLATQAANAFLTYATGEAGRPEKLAATATAGTMLGWALAGAEVECEGVTISPRWLRDVGRDLVTGGEHLSRIVTSTSGPVRLIRQSSWSWDGGDADPQTWMAEATETGPQATTTRHLPFEALVWLDWATDRSSPYIGRPPTDLADSTARLAANVELSLSREAGGDVAKVLPMPMGGQGDDEDDASDTSDPMKGLRDDLSAAKGRSLLVESTANNHDMGGRAPQDDWKPRRVGPEFTPDEATVATDAHQRLLNATGTPIGLVTDADGTSQREGLRRWHMGIVVPVARLIEAELTDKLERPCRLRFDPYPLDMQTRISQFTKLVDVEGIDVATAAKVVGIEGL